jgi:hypothetical protein
MRVVVVGSKRGPHIIKPGGTKADSHWFRSPNHAFCNGYAICKWQGEDAGGHKFSFTEKILLKHNNCPGYKKKKK